MKKILVSIATTLISAIVLVACNGSGTNASDITSSGAATANRGTCTALANWQSVGIGMSTSQVEARLGKPATITTTAADTQYFYEACRGFAKIETEATAPTQPIAGTPPTPGVPGKPATYSWLDVGGVVTISGSRGVTASKSPERPASIVVVCEFDYYRYPEATVLYRDVTTRFNDGSVSQPYSAQYIPSQYCRDPGNGTQF